MYQTHKRPSDCGRVHACSRWWGWRNGTVTAWHRTIGLAACVAHITGNHQDVSLYDLSLISRDADRGRSFQVCSACLSSLPSIQIRQRSLIRYDRAWFISQNHLCLRPSLNLLNVTSKETARHKKKEELVCASFRCCTAVAELQYWKIQHASHVGGALSQCCCSLLNFLGVKKHISKYVHDQL